MAFKDRLAAEIQHVKRERFVDGYEATDAEALGLILAGFLGWDGVQVMRTAEYALEDSNFHTACAKLAAIRVEEERAAEPARVIKVPSGTIVGKSYDVTLGDEPTCSCPDFTYRRARRPGPCKHILWAQTGSTVAWPR